MKKIITAAALIFAVAGISAQFRSVNAALDRLEATRMTTRNLGNVAIEQKKFVLIKEFDDHAERDFITVSGKNATFVEVFDDKKTGQSTSNIFTGDVVRTANNVISFRFDKLENKTMSLPLTKTLLLAKQKNILYLLDVNTKERWIDEAAIGKK